MFYRFRQRFLKWGYDNEGDFTLQVVFVYFTFYKWSSPIVRVKDVGFVPLNDGNSKEIWRLVRKE
jgi:hypothetical protein